MSNTLKKTISILAALLIWQLASIIAGYRILLPSPIDVISTLFRVASQSGFWQTVAISTIRIIIGFLAAYIIGILLAVLANRFSWLEIGFRPFMLTIKSVPVASFIVLALIWMGSSKLPSFVCFAATLPIVYNNVLEGLKNVDKDLKEAAENLGAGWFTEVRTVSIPSATPYLLSAASIGSGTAFKAGVAAEVVAVLSGSIGEKLYMSKVYFETAELFAWTLVIILLSFLFEKAIIKLVKFAITSFAK